MKVKILGTDRRGDECWSYKRRDAWTAVVIRQSLQNFIWTSLNVRSTRDPKNGKNNLKNIHRTLTFCTIIARLWRRGTSVKKCVQTSALRYKKIIIAVEQQVIFINNKLPSTAEVLISLVENKNNLMEHTMHHHLQNNIPSAQIQHWNYSSPSATPLSTPLTSTPNNNTWTPPTTRGMKRAMSESDCDDIYSEESSKEQ